MNEYYENGPEGMPRVERMTDSTIMVVLSQKNVPTIYVHSEQDYASLRLFAHAIAEETLARVPAWPAERTTSPVSQMTDEQQRQVEKCLRDGAIMGSVSDSTVDVVRAILAAAAPHAQAPAATVAEPSFNQAEFDAMVEKGTKAWAGVPAPRQEPQPVAEQGEITFDRRWSLAQDGFGVERNDESGEYVAHDDAIAVLHAAIAASQH